MTVEQQVVVLMAQKQRLRRAMRSGVLMVSHGDKHMRYRSIGEMSVALADIDAEIGQLVGTRRSRMRYFTTSKALG